MDDLDALKAKAIEELNDFRRGIERSADNKYRLQKESWETFYCFLDACLEAYRCKWFDEFVALVCKELNRDKILFSDIPTKAEMAIKSFQFTNVAAPLAAAQIINISELNDFVWLYFKTTSPGDAYVCRGYFSRYEGVKYLFENLCHDVYKHFLEKEQFPLVEKSQALHDKAQELAVRSAGFAFFVLGIDPNSIDNGPQE